MSSLHDAPDRDSEPAGDHSFAYLFERFPSFIQTFVYREVAEMVRQEMNPWLVSIRRPEDDDEVIEQLGMDVAYLPESSELRAEIDGLRSAGKLPGKVHRAIPEWRKRPDSNRVFEAAWIGPRLKERKIKHVHAHFGGLAARTAWTLRELFGITYSFTGHANDIFCENDFPVTNTMLVRDAAFVVTETEYARDWMKKKYPYAGEKIFRIYNGISGDGFPPHEPLEFGALPRIVSVGRFVKKKGFDVLIEACRMLRDRKHEFECVIIGGGPLEAELRAQIEAARLKEVIAVLGPRKQSEIRKLLSMSHVFALACVLEPDGGSDNLPTVIIEAMHAGLPVVSTRIAGVPEILTDGVEGLLVEPNDPEAFANALEKMLLDDNFADSCRKFGRAAAGAKFTIEGTTKELKHLLVNHGKVPVRPEARALDPALPVQSWFGRIFGGVKSAED